jgi:parvulin-like peptidyl-prolyl isomerase
MKNWIKIAITASIFYNCAFNSAVVNAADDALVATYKGGQVKESQVFEQFKDAFEVNPNLKGKSFSQLEQTVQESLVKAYINLKLLEKEVEKSKIEDSKDFNDKVSNFKKQLAQSELVNKIIAEKVTDKLLEDEYGKFVQEMKGREEIKVKHILLKTLKEAESVKQRLSKGEKFADLAKKLSEDIGSKSKGGEIGYFSKGQTDPAFEEKAFSLKKGETSSPVETQFGFHIIQLVDKRPITLPSKEDGMSVVKARLSKAAVEAYVEDLNNQAEVKILVKNADVK